MPNTVGQPLTFWQKWAFVVEIESVKAFGCTTCSAFEREYGAAEQRQGGSMAPVDVTVTNYKVADITCARGASDNTEISDWDQAQKAGDRTKKQVSIVAQDAAGNEIGRVNYERCSLIKYTLGDFDGKNQDANADETVVIRPTDGDRVS